MLRPPNRMRVTAVALGAVVVPLLGGSVVGVVPPVVAAWLLFGGTVVWCALRRPLGLLVLLPFAVAFGSLFALNLGSIRVGPTDALVAALVVTWFFRCRDRSLLAKRPPGRLPALLFLGLALYLAAVALSLVVATDRAAALKEVIKWSEVAVTVVVAADLLRSALAMRVVVWAAIGAGVAEALLGFAQWALSAGQAGPGGASIRVFGTFDQPNPYGGFLNFALPLALALLLFARDPRERWVAGGAATLLLVAQGMANSRGAFLGLAAALVVLLVVGWRLERPAVIATAVSVPLFMLAWVTHLIPLSIQDKLLAQVRLNDVMNGQINNANFSTVERLAHWIAGLRMFVAHPLLGVGAGNYNAAYPAYRLPDWYDPLGHAHNYYINVAAETGTLGLAAFLFLTGVSLVLAWRVARGARSTPLFPLAVGFLATLVALAVHNLTDDLFVHAMELLFALYLGCLLRIWSWQRAKSA